MVSGSTIMGDPSHLQDTYRPTGIGQPAHCRPPGVLMQVIATELQAAVDQLRAVKPGPLGCATAGGGLLSQSTFGYLPAGSTTPREALMVSGAWQSFCRSA